MQNLHLECLYPSLKGNGWCDQMNNIPACYYDGGDCIKTNTHPPPYRSSEWYTHTTTTSTVSSSISAKTTTSSSKR